MSVEDSSENPGDPLYEFLEFNHLKSIYPKFGENDINLEISHLIDIEMSDLDRLCQELQLTIEQSIKFKKIVKILNNSTNSNNNIKTVNTIRNIDYKLKIVLVGDSGTGKTSLIQRYMDNTFLTDYVSTIGIDFGTKSILTPNNSIVQLQIWDTCGQERFDSVSQQYFRGAHCIIIVYDVTQRSTFESIERRWIKQIENIADRGTFILLVGNKLDIRNTWLHQNINRNGGDADISEENSCNDESTDLTIVTNEKQVTPMAIASANTVVSAAIGPMSPLVPKSDIHLHDDSIHTIIDDEYKFVSKEEGLNLATKYNLRIVETSAKSGHHIPSLFLMCAMNALERKDELGLIHVNSNEGASSNEVNMQGGEQNNNNNNGNNGKRKGFSWNTNCAC